MAACNTTQTTHIRGEFEEFLLHDQLLAEYKSLKTRFNLQAEQLERAERHIQKLQTQMDASEEAWKELLVHQVDQEMATITQFRKLLETFRPPPAKRIRASTLAMKQFRGCNKINETLKAIDVAAEGSDPVCPEGYGICLPRDQRIEQAR